MQINQKVSTLPEDGSYESLRLDIRTLFVGRNVLNRNYTGRNQLPSEVANAHQCASSSQSYAGWTLG